jgi:hypothetical protein
MRRTGLLAVCVLVALAVASATAASGSAEPPEFGRCVKQAGGKFKTGNCTTAAVPGEERFEWLPGVVNNKFKLVSKAATLVVFETVGGTKVTCTGESATGEYTGPKSVGNVVMTFTGCECCKIPCNTKGAKSGELVFAALEGEPGIIKKGATPARSKAGLELFAPGGGNWADFSCSTVHTTIKGAVIVALPANGMKLSYAIKLTCGKGQQKPEAFEGGPQAALEINMGTGPQRGCLIASLDLTNEEKVELSTVN